MSVRTVDDCTLITFLLFNNIFLGRQPRQDAIVLQRFTDWILPHFSLDSWPLKMAPTDCPETSVRNYHYSLPNNPEERSCHLRRGENLKSRVAKIFFSVS